MSSIFEQLNDLMTENSVSRVLGVALLILVFATAVALGLAYWITGPH